MSPTEPATLWSPSHRRVAASRLSAYISWLRDDRGLSFEDYGDLWIWSTTDLEAFWRSIADYFGVLWRRPPRDVLASRDMPGAEWFPGATLNWAEHTLRADGRRRRSSTGLRPVSARNGASPSCASRSPGSEPVWSGWVSGRGDRVAGYLANTPEAVAAVLACASLGAIWSSCPPEFGVSAVLDRFRQIEPQVLLAHDGYPYNGRFFDRSAEVDEIRSGLPDLERRCLCARPEHIARDTSPGTS